MAKQEYEFTLILSGVRELSREVLDAFYEAGCDDALIGMRDGVAYADFCREGASLSQALLSAIRDVEKAGVGARVEHVEPDEFVTMAEIARRLQMSREGVRKRVAGLRGPGHFPPPAGSLTRRSPLWHWSDVLRWLHTHGPKDRTESPASQQVRLDMEAGSQIAAVNAALELRRRTEPGEALNLLRGIMGSGTARNASSDRTHSGRGQAVR